MSQLDAWYRRKCWEISNKVGTVERRDKVSQVGQVLELDMSQGFPLLNLKPTPWRLAIKELLWFMSDSYLYQDLENAGVTWWKPWVEDYINKRFGGSLSDETPLVVSDETLPYKRHRLGFQMVSKALLSEDWDNTRLYVSLWEPNIGLTILPPCALAYQVMVDPGRGQVSMNVYQRSADLLCGVPSNVAQYAFLLTVYSQIIGFDPGKLMFTYGDLHIYTNHMALEAFSSLLNVERYHKALERPPIDLLDVPYAAIAQSPNPAQASGLQLSSYKPGSKLNFPVAEVHTTKYEQRLTTGG